MTLKHFLFCFLLSFSSLALAEEGSDDELLGAFANLNESMGSSSAEPEAVSDPAVDDALQAAFDPIPPAIKEGSKIPLERVDGPETKAAIEKVAQVPIDGDLRSEYVQEGTAVSLLLWQGSQKAMRSLLTNILKQLYADNDPKAFRFILDSSPSPILEAVEVDLNREWREQEVRAAEFESRFLTMGLKKKARDIPVRMGLEIHISAGMFATFKTVDELAAQLAKALARLNPQVYGFREDPRFTQNQKYIEMINQISEGGSETSKREAKEKKTEMLADFAAMERLNAAGFSPWALFNYEERYFTWIADIFLKSPNHSVARSMLGSKIYRLDDWSRPLRLQLQNCYMRYLQGIERGKDMHLEEREFSPTLKRIRFRLYLYTRPFFLGLWYQVTPVVLASGAILFPYLFPHAAHSALEALNFSADGPIAQWLGESATYAKDRIGSLLSRGGEPSEEMVNSSYWGSGLEAAKGTLGNFLTSYTTILTVGTSAITAAFLYYYAQPIGNALTAARDAWIERRKIRKVPRDILNTKPSPVLREAPSPLIETEYEVPESEPEMELEEIGDVPPRMSIYTSLVARWNFAGRAARASGVALREFAEAGLRASRRLGGNSLSWMGRTSVATVHGTISGTAWLGRSSWQLGARAAHAGQRGTIRAWQALARVAAATPAATQRGAEATGRLALRIGRGTKNKGIRLAKGTLAASHFLFIDLPVGLSKGSLMAARELREWTAQSQIAFKEWREQYAIDSQIAATKRAAQKAKDKVEKEKKAEAKRVAKETKRLALVQASLERDQRLDMGLGDRNHLLGDSATTLRDLHDLMERYYFLEKDSESFEKRESLGFPSRWAARQRYEYFLRAYEKWIKTAQSLGTELQTQELIDMLDLMNKVHQEAFARVQEKRYAQNGIALYRLLERSSELVITYRLQEAKTGEGSPFLRYIALRSQVANSKVAPTSAADRVQMILGAGEGITLMAVEDLYRYHEAEILKWMAAPSTERDIIRTFLSRLGPQTSKGFFNREYRRRFRSAAHGLTLMERSKVYLQAGDLLLNATDKGTVQFFHKALPLLVESWCREASDIRALADRVQSELTANQLDPSQLRSLLGAHVIKHPELIKTEADALALFEHSFFWSETISQSEETTPLEEPLVELLEAKRAQFANNAAWLYDPIFSEKVHSMVKGRLVANNCYPTEYAGLEKLWKAFTSRGVSTVADDILGVLLKSGTPNQIQGLENYAVREGRVFDQGLRDEFAIREIKRSPQYREILRIADLRDSNRIDAINNLITLAQELMSDLGIRYVEFLEEVSILIRSSFEEAEILHEAKAKSLIKKAESIGSGANDSRVKTLYAILPYIKSWRPSRQYDFLLYLRGSIPATPFIIKQFPRFGPERIRKMYQGLPLEAAMAVVNLYLQETLLARKSVHEGWGKTLMQFLVQKGSVGEVESQANILLEGLLYGVEKANNKPFQKQVLSALIAMKPDEKASLGETIKVILEQFPGIGPKVGQFLVATGLLKPDVEKVVAETQDNTLPPKRYDMYKDLEVIVGKGKDIGIDILDLLGSGSLKYSVSGRERKSGHEVALQVFREDVQNNADLQIKVLNGLIEYAIQKGGQKWAFLQVIVDGAMNAVAREKQFDQESSRTAVARKKLYANFSDDFIDVAVPLQTLVNKRLLVSRFAHGTSFRRLKKEDQQKAGIKILLMESDILWNDEKGGIIDHGDDVIEYDTDRHSGNYVTDADAQPKMKLSPIDFGQLTRITRAQRDRVVELFSYGAILTKLGSNEWIAGRIARMFDLNHSATAKLSKILAEMFPMSHDSKIVGYFSVIAAVNQAIKDSPLTKRHPDIADTGKLDFFYTDFVRAHIQTAGIEKMITVPEEVMTPQKILYARVEALAKQHLQEMVLSTRQQVSIFAVNAKNKLVSKLTGRPYEAVDIRNMPKKSAASANCEERTGPGAGG